jgi:hypothetical protein
MPYGLRFEDACLYRQNPPSVLGFLGIVIVFSFCSDQHSQGTTSQKGKQQRFIHRGDYSSNIKISFSAFFSGGGERLVSTELF